MKRVKSLERYFYALDYEKEIKSKLTSKQFIVYTYLLSISKWDSQTKEEHYYVYFNSFTAKEEDGKAILKASEFIKKIIETEEVRNDLPTEEALPTWTFEF